MKDLNKKAFGGLSFLLVVIGASLFLPAWTFIYWQAWIFLAVFSASVLAITLYLIKKDQRLLERRVNGGPTAEKETVQKIIQSLAGVAFIAIFVLSALDHRFGWSVVSIYFVVAGDILVMLGLFMVFLVFKENTFTSAIIEIDVEQKVISTGPYALVRHPMYIGAFVMLVGVSPSLGSWWGSLAVIPIVLVIIWRLLNEEKFLAKNLPGYTGYRDKVKYRLIPFIW
jgi:protein-S-isoprenylcysteine O-methyltransferase Ste14